MLLKVKHTLNNRISLIKSTSIIGFIALLLMVGCGGANSAIQSVENSYQSNNATTVASTPQTNESSLLVNRTPQTTQNSADNISISSNDPTTEVPANTKIQTVFIIMMENHNWSDIVNNPSAPYINKMLLPQASYATEYFNPPHNHPSEPNYLWLEAGSSLGIKNDDPPADNHQTTTDHLVTYLDKAGVTWKAYAEDISGKVCPLTSTGLYSPKHTPMVFFDDVTGGNDSKSKYCISHIRPYTELQSDLQQNTVAKYNFITPNLCNDMHDSDGCVTPDAIRNGDTWLSQQIPMITASNAYKQSGVIFILWDESENGDHPIGMIVLSPLAKGGGYSNNIHYTHSSLLKTVEEIFNISPLLGDASKASDLGDLFKQFP